MLAEELSTLASTCPAHTARSHWEVRFAGADGCLEYHPGDALSMSSGFFWHSVLVGPQACVDL